ncbi:MAG: hypothetical protein CYG59_25125 [Chloroflexi bacterium]|nr:MAG: hypothetical protein CYG59_25125 [Chloroflexota bacterium]
MVKRTAVVSLPDTATIEETLLTIPGVREARIMRTSETDIGEVHIIASPRRAPKKIVRDIETLLVVRFAYRIDYRRVSLVQIPDSGTADRVTLGRVEQIQQPDCTYMEVDLVNGLQRFTGRCAVGDDPAEAASRATIMALNGLFAPQSPLELAGVQCTTFGARQVVTTYVTYQDIALEHVLGTTFVRSSVAEAAARSVLAATNRRLAGWLPDQHSALALIAAGG